MNIESLIKELTLEEKAALLSGTDFMYTNPVPRLKIPGLCMSDGPHGLRKQKGENQDNGIAVSEPATSFPTAAATASGWNPQNTFRMGEAIAEECAGYGVDLLLGPGVNIKRNPLCGRNFEYFSEDPLLAGKMGAAEVRGIQKEGIGVSVKHYALNNSENYRFMGDSIADERTIREIYLKPFEHIVKEAHPVTMMCAYNRINGTFCSENHWLLTEILRDEWGFDGAVMTDWGAVRDRAEGVRAGLEIEMPGDTPVCRKQIIDSVNQGTLSMEVLDESVRRVLQLVKTSSRSQKTRQYRKGGLTEEMRQRHHRLAGEIAADCAVLLENDGILPLKEDEELFIAGELFEKMRYQGAGSSMINSAVLNSPMQEFNRRKISYRYVKGYHENTQEREDELTSEAVKASEGTEKVIIFAGLTDYVESEGADRENMRLPDNQLVLINAMIEAGKKIVVVLFGGSSMELPFAGKVNAILDLYLPGQNGGYAAAALLFGEKNPSGRLAETWVMGYDDVPFGEEFGKGIQEKYKENVFVGYRYYETAKKPVRYPFGYGLSYTDFMLQNLTIHKENDRILVSCTVTNTGKREGAEVVQCYVHFPESGFWKPVRELAAFEKIYLKAGETGSVTMEIPVDQLKHYSMAEKAYVLEGGTYCFQIGKNVSEILMEERLELAGSRISLTEQEEKVRNIYQNVDLKAVSDSVFEQLLGHPLPVVPLSLPIHMESRFTDLNQTFMGRILFRAVLSVAGKARKEALALPEGAERDNRLKGAVFLQRILESNSIRSMSMSSGKSFPYHFAEGFVNLANGHLLKGIRCFLSAPRVAKLPKDE